MDFFISLTTGMNRKIHLSGFIVVCILVMLGKSLYAQASVNYLRVISLAPHITEIIYKLKADYLLVGRTDFCNYPPAVKKITSVGGYLNIDFEKIVALKPDLIFQFPNNDNQRKLEDLGFRVISVPNETLGDILGSIKMIGESLNMVEQAARLIENIEDTLRLVSKPAQGQTQSVSALLVVGRQQGSLAHLYLAGPSTYINELWSLCGGVNAFSEVTYRYFPVNAEDLITRNIDVILEFHPEWNMDPERLEAEKSTWAYIFLNRVLPKHKVYIFSQPFFVIPGPRITQIAIEFSKLIESISEESE
ncbi:MAG: hypothetical protein A2Y94_08895 [Caldithrix sp. RBG_13_44_9]|nr:MAG: hypothetical protein A2Y94_08895 [Caldithrix sp. RBG_13_44_9]